MKALANKPVVEAAFTAEMLMFDRNLVKPVHQESYHGFKIVAIITRMGGFAVFAFTEDELNLEWQGDNIMQARWWIEQYVKRASV
jgi:hypothetical protein